MNLSTLFSRTDQSVFGRWWWTVDRRLLAGIATLIAVGIVLVTTASPPVATRIAGPGHEYMFIKRHIVYLVPSLAIMFGMSLLSPRNIWRSCSVVLLACFVLLVLVPFVGEEIKGARRWIDLYVISLQPSEFAKPAFAVVAAWLLSKKQDRSALSTYPVASVVVFGLLLLLLIVQPDFGMSFVLSAIFAAQLFLAGLPWVLVGGLALAGIFGVGMAYLLLGHVASRIDRFLYPESGDNYQVERAVDAFRNGGVWGTGAGQGTAKLNIPDAHADFIFAVAGEELGLVMTCLLVLLYGYIILRGLNKAMDSSDMFVVLAIGGLLTMFGLQALVNMGSSVHLLPTKGMTLPFISYGGSSLLATGFGMGIVLALTRRQARTSIASGGYIVNRRAPPKTPVSKTQKTAPSQTQARSEEPT